MPFSLRLTADLTVALIYRALRPANKDPFIFSLSSGALAADGHAGSSDLDKLLSSPRFQQPIVWIGGAEPLEHPDIPRIANALAVSGRHVFLETSGVPLKPRLHELRPSSHLHIAVRFDEMAVPEACDDNVYPFRVGLEALRFARLCGFFTYARLIVGSLTGFNAVKGLHARINDLDVDGILISSAASSREMVSNVSKLRRQFLPRRWALFSRMLDETSTSAVQPVPVMKEKSAILAESQGDNVGPEAQPG